jgi:hypothetical protein
MLGAISDWGQWLNNADWFLSQPAPWLFAGTRESQARA